MTTLPPLFNELRSLEEFPFAPGSELKRRKNTKAGEGVGTKLCSDIYILTSVLDGAPFEDIKDLISTSKLSTQNESMYVDPGTAQDTPSARTQKTGSSDVDLSLLRGIISSVQADIISLKQDSNTQTDEIFKELDLIKNDIKTMKSDFANALKTSQSHTNSISEIRQTVDRICDDRSNGVANVKSDVKQIRVNVKAIDDTIEAQYSSLTEKLSDVKKLEKRLVKMESRINQNRYSAPDTNSNTNQNNQQDTISNNSELVTQKSTDNETEANKQSERSFTTECFHVVGNENSQTNADCSRAIVTDKTVNTEGVLSSHRGTVPRSTYLYQSPESKRIKRIPVEEMKGKAGSFSAGCMPPLKQTSEFIDLTLSDEPFQQSCSTRQQTIPKVSLSREAPRQNAILNTGVAASPPKKDHLCSYSENVQESSAQKAYQQCNNTDRATDSKILNSVSYECSVENRFDGLREQSYSDVLKSTNNSNQTEQNNETVSSIPVCISNRRSQRTVTRRGRVTDYRGDRGRNIPNDYNDNDNDNDDDFEMHIRRRSQRYYVGGFKPSITEAKLAHFVSSKGVPVTWVSIRRYENQNRAVIRLNVDADKGHQLLERDFWPRGVTCRPWVTKNQLQKTGLSNRNSYNNYPQYEAYDDSRNAYEYEYSYSNDANEY